MKADVVVPIPRVWYYAPKSQLELSPAQAKKLISKLQAAVNAEERKPDVNG